MPPACTQSAGNLRDGIRVSTAIGYLAPARHHLNLTIRGECLANRVLMENSRDVGVEVESGGETQRVYRNRIALSAGAFPSGRPQKSAPGGACRL